MLKFNLSIMDPLPTPNPLDEKPAASEAPGHTPGQVVGPAAPSGAPAEPQPPDTKPDIPTPASGSQPQVFEPAFSPGAGDRPMAVAGVPDSPAAPGPVTGQVLGHNDLEISQPKKSWFKNKKILVPAAAVFVLLGGSAAAYFGYYVPNKPDNLWKTALSRTGKGYQKLSDYVVGFSQNSGKGETYSGSLKLSGSFTGDGNFQGTTDGGNSQTTGSFSTSGINAKLDLRTIKSPTGTPDIYVKLDGLQGLGDLLGGGDPTYTSLINSVNGNWYFIDHSLLDQYTSQAGGSDNLTSKDIKNFLDAVYNPSNTYIFNADPTKEALVIKREIGKEKQDGRSVYHYVVGVNKSNLKDYNNALCDSLNNDKIYKLLSGSDPSALSDCKDTTGIDGLKDSSSADVWVDTHTKLIHRIRFTLNSGGSKSNLDVGQDYQGGDEIPFFLDYKDSSQDTTDVIHVGMTLNTATNKLSLDGTFNSTGRTASDKENGEIKFNLQPRNGALKVDKPSNAKNVLELLNSLGLDGLVSDNGSAGSGGSADVERKTDINALQGQIEAYYAQNGYYPTLANLNNPSWVSANFVGLDQAALKDPAGSAPKLAASPAAHVYAYQAAPSGCDNTSAHCTDYTLTATLDAGGTFVKKSLNSQPV